MVLLGKNMERKAGKNFMEEILRVYVMIEESFTVNGQKTNVNMLHFSGRAEGPYFKGIILPHGIDLQRGAVGQAMSLSARYMLEGEDNVGNKCRLFIENNGSNNDAGEMVTRPVIVTDSKALAWMEDTELIGSLSFEEGLVIIHICKVE